MAQQVYIVQGTLKHDGAVYAPGSEFTSDDEALVAELRSLGALRLPAEALSAQAIADQDAAQRARIAELEAELEAQKAAAAQAEADKSDGASEEAK